MIKTTPSVIQSQSIRSNFTGWKLNFVSGQGIRFPFWKSKILYRIICDDILTNILCDYRGAGSLRNPEWVWVPSLIFLSNDVLAIWEITGHFFHMSSTETGFLRTAVPKFSFQCKFNYSCWISAIMWWIFILNIRADEILYANRQTKPDDELFFQWNLMFSDDEEKYIRCLSGDFNDGGFQCM